MTITEQAGKDWARFWRKVNVTPFCWTWNRISKSKLGPRFQYKGSDVKIGRMAYYLCNGVWPVGGAFRRCANPLCVKPEHLDDVKQSDMPKTLSVMGRLKDRHHQQRARCKRGHRLCGTNVGVTTCRSGIQRFCRLCVNANHRARHARLRAEGRVGKI